MENKRTVFLTTTALDLVLLEPQDARSLALWFNNPEVTAFLLRGDYPMTEVSEVEYLEKLYKDTKELQLGILHRESSTLIGTTGLHRINAVHQTASFGIAIGDKSKWGKSYGTQTLNAILAYAFTRKNLRNVTLSVLGNNPRGKRCYEKCGFVEVGRYKNHIFKSGTWHDEILMICKKSESFRTVKAEISVGDLRVPHAFFLPFKMLLLRTTSHERRWLDV